VRKHTVGCDDVASRSPPIRGLTLLALLIEITRTPAEHATTSDAELDAILSGD
jgi:hypothetical protein